MSSNTKKISQVELRKFMSVHKRKANESLKRIESPLANHLLLNLKLTYSDSGVLTCILCNSVVKSEAVWNVHINSKQHRENIARKNQQSIPIELLKQDFSNIQKKQSPPTESITVTKKPKSILKNATPLPPKFFDDISHNDLPKVDEVPNKKIKLEEKNGEADDNIENGSSETEPMETDATHESELPEGFFDDPVLDAKARNVEYKDPVEEEWERFQREIKEETDLSAKLIHEDTEDATVQRQIEQIDEQISKLSRVVQLELKKDEVKAKVLTKVEIKKEEDSDGESNDSDIEVEFDWRAKSYLS